MEPTKTQRALALVDQGMKAFAAAREVGVAPNAVYLAIKKRRDATAAGFVDCPCCASLVPGEKTKRGLLKKEYVQWQKRAIPRACKKHYKRTTVSK